MFSTFEKEFFQIYLFLTSSADIDSPSNDTTRCFISNVFISNARLKLSKNQANAKQHPDAEILVFENYSNKRKYSKK